MKNYILTGVIALIVGVVIGYATHGQPSQLVGSGSPSGTVQSELQVAQETIQASTTATTTGSFAIYNNSYDRIVTDTFAACTGVASESQNSSWAVTAATSTAATTSSTAYLANLTLATTSATLYVSSTTAPTSGTGVNATLQLWPAGTYLVFSFNATDTAVCTVGSKFIAL